MVVRWGVFSVNDFVIRVKTIVSRGDKKSQTKVYKTR